MKKRILELSMTVLLLAGVYILSREGAALVSGRPEPVRVVLDAGHGDPDPGKIGVHGEKEREINLQIVKKLKKKLEKKGVQVILTRKTDQGLCDGNRPNFKVEDLQKRVEVIHSAAPVCAVSIHQNSYGSEAVRGAQVFYYRDSPSGKELAETLQQALIDGLDPQNHRLAKGNVSYYLLKKTSVPLAIVECGFLSNPQEASLLTEENYQNKIADAVCEGILAYVEKQKIPPYL